MEHGFATEAFKTAVARLCRLIETPSFSGSEQHTADFIQQQLNDKNFLVERVGQNVFAKSKKFNPLKPSLLLNSHHDTVKPNSAYTRQPFHACIEDDKFFGLGSNDAGASLVCLWSCFEYWADRDLPFNLIFAASAEEENSGPNGISALIPHLPEIHMAIVGEPTLMQMAIAEKGLMVIDAVAQGKAGHAAREEGINAIYQALEDIALLKTLEFPEVSEELGPVKFSVTVIHAGEQHNQVPSECRFTIDVRSTDAASNETVFSFLQSHLKSELHARSFRLQPTSIPKNHPLVQSGLALGRNCYGSPTTSDKALMPWPALKLGPGFSGRSHMADEFVYLHEIEEGIDLYQKWIAQLIPYYHD
jgi:acetylornithine deacetylase